MENKDKKFIPSSSIVKNTISEVSKRFDLTINHLRNSNLRKFADALKDAQQKIVSNGSLTDEQKDERIKLLNRIGEESSKKERDNSFFAKFKNSLDSFVSNVSPGSPSFITVSNIDWLTIGSISIEQLTDLIRNIDWSSIDIGDIDLSGF